MSTLVDLEGKQLQWGIGFDSPLFVSSFLLTSVMLRHEASASSVADTSFLSMTAYSRLVQIKNAFRTKGHQQT